jgi:predicted membrane protein
MDNLENKIERRYRSGRRRNNVWVGLLILLIGSTFLAREMGAMIPRWMFSWPMIVVVAGLFIGISNRFRDFGWLIIVAVGLFFLADDIWVDFSFGRYVWPLTIIIIGLVVIMVPYQRRKHRRFGNWTDDSQNPQPVEAGTIEPGTTEDVLEVVSIFAGVKKNIYSKSFRGGEIVCIFGGTEINLTHADFPGKEIRIEAVQIFGGTKLIVPANWDVRSEAVAIFGGVEDKRPQPTTSNPEKTVILEGFAMFGGLEIRSF